MMADDGPLELEGAADVGRDGLFAEVYRFLDIAFNIAQSFLQETNPYTSNSTFGTVSNSSIHDIQHVFLLTLLARNAICQLVQASNNTIIATCAIAISDMSITFRRVTSSAKLAVHHPE